MPMVVAGLGVASAVVGAVGALSSANAQAGADNYNAQIAAQKAQIEDWNRQRQSEGFARQARIEGGLAAVQEGRLEQKNQATEAHNIAVAASNGLQISGSTKGAILSSALNNEVQIGDDHYANQLKQYQLAVHGQNAAYQSQIQQGNDEDEYVLDSKAAQNARTSGYLSAAGALIGGAGSVIGSNSNLDYRSGSYGKSKSGFSFG